MRGSGKQDKTSYQKLGLGTEKKQPKKVVMATRGLAAMSKTPETEQPKL